LEYRKPKLEESPAESQWRREAQALTMSNFSSIEHSLVLVIKVVTMIKHTKLRFVGAVQ
jgi:hypothetical protein